MQDFFIQTFTNPSVFWSALEAIATSIALLFILIELRRLKRESTEKKIEGMKFAAERLESRDFKEAFERIGKAMQTYNNEKGFPDEIENDLHTVLSCLDFISKLIELDYLNQDVFLTFKGGVLISTRIFISFLQHKGYQMADFIATYRGGYNLVELTASPKYLNKFSRKYDAS